MVSSFRSTVFSSQMKKGKVILHKILPSILGCLCLFLSGCTSLNSNAVERSVTCKLVANFGKDSDYGYSFATLNYGENSFSTLSSAFSFNYSKNFSSYMQAIPTALNSETNELLEFSSKINGSNLSRKIHVGNCIYYSNQKDLKRFETLLINVYDNNTFVPRGDRYNADGFVFIPDFYADELIANSNGLYKTYSDLLPKSSSNEDARNAVTININDGSEEYVWAIVGVYHARDFTSAYLREDFQYNDKSYGAMLNDFGNPFFISWDSVFSKKHINGVLLGTDSKQYLIEQMCQTFASYGESGVGKCSFFALREGTVVKAQGVPSSISFLLFANANISPFYFLFLMLSATAAIAFSVSIRKNKFSNIPNYLLETSSVPLIVGVFSTLFLALFNEPASMPLRFFSYYLGIFVLVLLAISASHFLYFVYRQRKNANEM